MSISKICRCMLYTVGGWKKNITETHPQKCIICLAPHTSNWDFIVGQLYSHAEGMKFNFLMKKEWFFWPLGSLFKKMGGIPVYRDKASSMTNRLAEIAKKNDYFRLVITPEGTRSPRKEWKRGFYYIAQEAGIPIMLYGADFEKKEIICTKTFWPSGDYEKDITEIKEYYKDIKGKKPENFVI